MRADDGARASFVAPIRLRNLLWVPVLGGLWLVSVFVGTPHLRVWYRWNGSDRHPVYYACTYWGRTTFNTNPSDGACPLVVFARPTWER